MIRQMLHSLFMLLPADERMRVATWRFAKVRESFYTETRLDIVAKKGVRNRETMLERLTKLEKRSRSRKTLVWPAYQAIARRMQAGDDFARAMKPFIPVDEYALLELAGTSTREDAAARGLELAAMAAGARRILSETTSIQMAYPAFPARLHVLLLHAVWRRGVSRRCGSETARSMAGCGPGALCD